MSHHRVNILGMLLLHLRLVVGRVVVVHDAQAATRL